MVQLFIFLSLYISKSATFAPPTNLPEKGEIIIGKVSYRNEEKKVYVEIDGEQHYVDPRIVESDIKRTNYLITLGWKGYRVRWATYKKLSYDEKHKIILEIKHLLS